MRRVQLLVLLGAACTSTDPGNGRVIASDPFWIEWPAEVLVDEPFDVRLVQWSPGCLSLRIRWSVSLIRLVIVLLRLRCT